MRSDRIFRASPLRAAVLATLAALVAAAPALAEPKAGSHGAYRVGGKGGNGYTSGNAETGATLRQRPGGIEGVVGFVSADHREMWIGGKAYRADHGTSVYGPDGLRKSLKDVVPGLRVVLQMTEDRAGHPVAKAVHIVEPEADSQKEI